MRKSLETLGRRRYFKPGLCGLSSRKDLTDWLTKKNAMVLHLPVSVVGLAYTSLQVRASIIIIIFPEHCACTTHRNFC